MYIVDRGLGEKFHKEFSWGYENVHVHFFTKSIRRGVYTGMILFIDENIPDSDGEDEEATDNRINQVTITKELKLKHVDAIQAAITEEYGPSQVSEIPSKQYIITQDAQPYIR